MTSIQTRYGLLAGGCAQGARHWLGVPFAKAARLGLPEPPESWTGVRSATRFGPQCPQVFGSMSPKKMIDGPAVSEDCLVLNIWTPDRDGKSPRPVMVWIHGGAFVAGSGNTYDGAELAARGDMVVVTINYRLGVLGFANFRDSLNRPDLPSNLGLRDQVAALEWVRDNIADFGGDPQRVTIAGESAGSLSVSMLMIVQRAWPLFHGAILQSGAMSLIHSPDRSRRVGQRYCEILGIAGDIDRLRALDVKTLLAAQSNVQILERGTVPGAPWYDGDLLPRSLQEARVAPVAKIPVLAGYNRDEIRTFEIMRGADILPLTRAANELLLRQQLSKDAAEVVLASYANTKKENRSLATHLTFGMPTLHFAERHSAHSPTWFYRFDYSHLLIGAAHGLDLAFIWNFRGPIGVLVRGGFYLGKRRALAERMRQHWSHFVHHGRPENDWPSFTLPQRATKLFNLVDRVVDDPDAVKRHAWNDADVSTNVASA